MKKNTIIYMIFILSLIVFSRLSFAQTIETDSQKITVQKDTFQISLMDAILTALERNPSVTIQRLQPKINKTVASEARAEFDPELTANATKSQTNMLRFLGSRPDPFEMQMDRFQYDVGLSEKLPSGTTVSADASMSGSLSSIYSDQYTGSIGITVTQSLLRDFWIGANLATLRKANIDVEMSGLELKAVAELVIASVEQAYWDLYLAAEEIRIQKKSLELVQQQLDESVERVNVGKLAKLELAAVHAEVATRKEALIDAKSAFEQARLNFIFLLNKKIPNEWDTLPLLSDEPFVPTDTLDTILIHEQLGLKYRPDLLQARLDLKKNALDITMTKNGLLPQLDFFITMGRTTYSRAFLSDALPDVTSPYYTVEGGLSFAFPVINRQSRAQLKRARYSQEQLELALENMERLVQKDVRSAYLEVLRSRQQITATKVAHELQQQKLSAEQEKFRVGKSTNYLVLQAQRDLIASQIDEVRAIISHLNAIVNLHLVEGTLLDRRGIRSL